MPLHNPHGGCPLPSLGQPTSPPAGHVRIWWRHRSAMRAAPRVWALPALLCLVFVPAARAPDPRGRRSSRTAETTSSKDWSRSEPASGRARGGGRREEVMGWHNIREGHLGFYWRFGALTPRVEAPGYRWMIPFGVDEVKEVSVSFETEVVQDVPCGTSGGVELVFDKVEVVFRLKRLLAWETLKNYSVAFADIWIRDLVPSTVNDVCNELTLHEVFISRFSDLDEIILQHLTTIHSVWAPGIEVCNTPSTLAWVGTDGLAWHAANCGEMKRCSNVDLLVSLRCESSVRTACFCSRFQAVDTSLYPG